MSAYARMLLGGGATLVDGHEVRVLDDDAFELLTTPHVETDERPFRYGYGVDVWEREGRSFVGHSGGMVGYTALLWLDRDSGLGCVAFLNGEGNRSEVVGYAIDAVREALAGTTPTPKPHPPASTAIDGADELAGTYVGPRTIELQRTSDGLRLVDGPIGVALERVPDEVDVFLVPHPARDRYLLHVVRGDDAAVLELGHGSDRFAPEGRDAHAGRAVPPGVGGLRRPLPQQQHLGAAHARVLARRAAPVRRRAHGLARSGAPSARRRLVRDRTRRGVPSACASIG